MLQEEAAGSRGRGRRSKCEDAFKGSQFIWTCCRGNVLIRTTATVPSHIIMLRLRETKNYAWDKADRISEGTFSKVFRGRRKDSGQLVAIKVKRAKGFYEEDISLLSSLNSPYLIQYYTEEPVLNSPDKWALVMELATGSLRTELRKPENKFGLSKETFLLLVDHCVKALEYLDLKHIAHRYINPEHILVTRSEGLRFKLAGFGLSVSCPDDHGSLYTILGTPAYMPSLMLSAFCSGDDQVSYTKDEYDIWATAYCFFEAATARLAFLHWNVDHGGAFIPKKRNYLGEMLRKTLAGRPPGATWARYDEKENTVNYHYRLPLQQSTYTRHFRPILAKFFALLFSKDKRFCTIERFSALCGELLALKPRLVDLGREIGERYDTTLSQNLSGDLSLYRDEEPSAPSPAVSVQTFHDYVFKKENRIGKGSFSKVFKGYHRTTEEAVAVKVCNLLRCVHPDDSNRFYLENISLLKTFDCPCILRYLDGGEMQGVSNKYAIVTELADGTVRDELKKRSADPGLPQSMFITLVDNCLTALEYLDVQGIAHRDLKPENIFIFNKPRLTFKLADFGLSCSAGAIALAQTTKLMVGTPEYMLTRILSEMAIVFGTSEESGSSSGPTAKEANDYNKDKIDLWATAFCFFECASGVQPFRVCEGERNITSSSPEFYAGIVKVHRNRPSDTVCGYYDTELKKFFYQSDLPQLNSSYSSSIKPVMRRFFQRMFDRNDKSCLKIPMFSQLCRELISAGN